MHGTLPSLALAQQRRPPTDTLRTRADTLRARADSARARGDTLRARRDSTRAPVDTLGPRVDTLRAGQDTLRAPADTLKARADSIAADSLERESRRILEEQRRRADTVKAPIAAAEMPRPTDLGDAYRWGREELAATGALTLGDLLERVPGLTIYRSGWVGSPQVGAMLGDLQKVRVFFDGIELDALDPRNGGQLDLSFVQLWHLEEVRIERGASEIRVHLRSWRVRSVTPSTRIDIGTGDLETNGYRGYFGRRFRNGAALQLGAYQIGTRDNRGAGDADGLSLFGRAGWARGRFSFDASMTRTTRDRTEQLREEPLENLPVLDGHFTEAYARGAYTDTVRGTWVQVIAARLSHAQNNLAFEETVQIPRLPTPSELTFSRQQLVGAAGWERGPWSASATARLRRIDSTSYLTPSARVAFETPRLAIAGFAEQQEELRLRRVEASGRVLPLSWLGVAGAVSYFQPSTAGLFPSALTFRGEVGLRLNRAWLAAGLMSRDSARLSAPVVFDSLFVATSDPAATALFVTFRGKVWKDVGVDMVALKWDSAGAYRPQYQTRAQLYVNTSWRSRFPSGNLNILASVTHEYRTGAFFPIADERLQSSQYRVWSAQLEIRLLQATLHYQFRNFMNAEYQQVPGFFMHRPVQFYGVRWYFFN